MISPKFLEITQEVFNTLNQRSNVLDAVLPPITFVFVNTLFNFTAAIWSALLLATVIGLSRLSRGRPLAFAFGGVLAVLFSMIFMRLVGRDEAFFLPIIFSNIFMISLILISVVFNRPLAAWGSHLIRRWPLAWYWHPLVRPAYTQVTITWMMLIAIRTVLQLLLYNQGAVNHLAIFSMLSGWPTTFVVLVASYYYGSWQLRRLQGPSVEEFYIDAQPPWSGQQRGF